MSTPRSAIRSRAWRVRRTFPEFEAASRIRRRQSSDDKFNNSLPIKFMGGTVRHVRGLFKQASGADRAGTDADDCSAIVDLLKRE
jgi:hypothetical protein